MGQVGKQREHRKILIQAERGVAASWCCWFCSGNFLIRTDSSRVLQPARHITGCSLLAARDVAAPCAPQPQAQSWHKHPRAPLRCLVRAKYLPHLPHLASAKGLESLSAPYILQPWFGERGCIPITTRIPHLYFQYNGILILRSTSSSRINPMAVHFSWIGLKLLYSVFHAISCRI